MATEPSLRDVAVIGAGERHAHTLQVDHGLRGVLGEQLGRILIDQQLGNVRSVGGGGFSIFQRGSVLCPAAVGIIGVAGHREQPRPYILPVVVVFQAVQSLEESLLCQFFGQRLVVGQALQDRSRKAHKWLYFPL